MGIKRTFIDKIDNNQRGGEIEKAREKLMKQIEDFGEGGLCDDH